jgi:hypothetical protein
MNVIQKTLSSLFPKYKSRLIIEEQKKLFHGIMNALPDHLSDLKTQAKINNFQGLKKFDLHPHFKYTEIYYPGENYFKYKIRGKNSKISGLRIFSKVNQRFEEAEILIWDNLIWALKINHSNYDFKEFDFSKVRNNSIDISNFDFPSRKIDLFYDSLDEAIQERLDYNELFDEEIDGKIFYTFYALEDGNTLAVDEELNVYSIAYDTDDMIVKMNISFIQILEDIAANRFDEKKHIEERYKN